MHETVLQIVLSNAAVATALAFLAFAVTVFFRRPALAHAAWLLVLLKLLTPPIVTLPVEWPRTSVDETQSVTERPLPVYPVTPNVEVGLLEDDAIIDSQTTQLFSPDAYYEPAGQPVELPEEGAWTHWRLDWPLMLTTLWAAGSTIVLLVIVSRLWRFRRVLRYAALAPEHVQGHVESLCADLDIHPAPRLFFVPGGVCPMLIGLGRASRILVPRDLWSRLDNHQQATLLVHELAHLRRGDQWVRLIELLVTVLYWWHPVAWFARRELREAEEQCCDAWVVFAMPRSARDYAVALMEAIDFTTRSRPTVVPVLGSGMGEFHHLRRRLIMIKQGRVAKALTWSGFTAMCAVGALLLPLSPTFAEPEKPAEAEPADPFSVVERLDDIEGLAVFDESAAPALAAEPAAPAGAVLPPATVVEVEEDALFAAEADQEKAALNAELAATQEAIKQLNQELAKLHQRLAQLHQQQRGVARRIQPMPGAPGGMGMPRAGTGRAVNPPLVFPRAPQPGVTPKPVPQSVKPVKPKSFPGAPNDPNEFGQKFPTPARGRGADGNQDERLDALEERLAALLDEVRSLRKQPRNAPNTPGQQAQPPAVEPAPRPEPQGR